jgi:hypothetical protein
MKEKWMERANGRREKWEREQFVKFFKNIYQEHLIACRINF